VTSGARPPLAGFELLEGFEARGILLQSPYPFYAKTNLGQIFYLRNFAVFIFIYAQ